MSILGSSAILLSLVLIGFIFVECFETLVVPRRIERPLRGVSFFYSNLWRFWRKGARFISVKNRDNYLCIFGPLSLLLLLSIWAVGLIYAFALLQWGLQSPIHAPDKTPDFFTYVYLSATTFVTLGFGDVVPSSRLGRFLVDVEAGVGFGFFALVIGYFPVLYGAFSRREVDIALLDARASSPPSAGAWLQRAASSPILADLYDVLRQYERWAAELLESHLSYPVLMWYRSQHDRQSWLSALTTLLDTCALLIAAYPEGNITWQARMTFAMCRHAAGDLSYVFDIPTAPPDEDRLPPERFAELSALLANAGLKLSAEPEAEERLTELRGLYEPHVNTLAKALELTLPSWMPNPDLPDNWQTSKWDRSDHFFHSTAEQATRQRQRRSSRLPLPPP
jgi:hypothetical protein